MKESPSIGTRSSSNASKEDERGGSGSGGTLDAVRRSRERLTELKAGRTQDVDTKVCPLLVCVALRDVVSPLTPVVIIF